MRGEEEKCWVKKILYVFFLDRRQLKRNWVWFFFLSLSPPAIGKKKYVTFNRKSFWGKHQRQKKKFFLRQSRAHFFSEKLTYIKMFKKWGGERNICLSFPLMSFHQKQEAFILPTPQPPTVACKMEAQSEYVHVAYTAFARFAPICMLGRCLLTKFLPRSSEGSLLVVHCRLGPKFRPLKLSLFVAKETTTAALSPPMCGPQCSRMFFPRCQSGHTWGKKKHLVSDGQLWEIYSFFCGRTVKVNIWIYNYNNVLQGEKFTKKMSRNLFFF